MRNGVLARLIRFVYSQYPDRPFWIQRQVPPFADGRIWNAVPPQLNLTAKRHAKHDNLKGNCNYRDSNVRDYDRALDYLSDREIRSLRVGAVVEDEYPSDNPMIIDYAWKYRSDFSFLAANSSWGTMPVSTRFPSASEHHLFNLITFLCMAQH